MGSFTVFEVAETGSTNSDLLALADADAVGDRTALRADHQTAGRGRLDRRWEAPAGTNLLVSALFTEPPPVPSLLTQAVGRAVLDAVERLVGQDLGGRLGLKWPNDLLLDERKLSGVLAQRSAATGAIVVGMGLNVRWAPPDAASLVDGLGVEVTPGELLDRVLVELDRNLSLPVAEIVGRYRSRLLTLGARVRLDLPGGESCVGVAIDLDETGRLVIDDGRSTNVFDVGDIVHLRPV